MTFGLHYNYAAYNTIGEKNLSKTKKYYNLAANNIKKFSNEFLDLIPMLNSMIINNHFKEKDWKRKIPFQKSFNNKKISFESVIKMINQNLRIINEYE